MYNSRMAQTWNSQTVIYFNKSCLPGFKLETSDSDIMLSYYTPTSSTQKPKGVFGWVYPTWCLIRGMKIMDELNPSHVWLEGRLMWSYHHKPPRVMQAMRDELIHNFFEDLLISDSLTLRFTSQPNTTKNGMIPSIIYPTKHTLSLWECGQFIYTSTLATYFGWCTK
jgi:hypothetical protein